MDLYDKLVDYSQSDVYPFHMPGHKRQVGHPFLQEFPNPYAIDITEIDGFDNLHHAEGIIRESMDWAARRYGADWSYYLVNGSSCGILSAVCGMTRHGGKILMSRNCHKAAYHGVFLNRLRVEYIYPQIIEEFGIQGGLVPEDVEKVLKTDHDIQAVLVVSPTYDGIVSDVEKIVEVCHGCGIPLIVDEAHGAHFRYHKGFPVSALDLGADVVIQSLHKTLPAFTQTSILHVRGDLVDRERLEHYLQIFQSSSPSYVLMASIENCIRWMDEAGRHEMMAFDGRLDRIRQQLMEMECLTIVDGVKGRCHVFDVDRSKIVVSVGKSGLTGPELQERLRREYRLEMEMCGADYVTAITTPMDRDEGLRRLGDALTEVDARMEFCNNSTGDTALMGLKTSDRESGNQNPVDPQPVSIYSMRSDTAMTIADAMDGTMHPVKLEDSAGCISGEFVYIYPPGIPIVAPGEWISKKALDVIREYIEKKLPVQGAKDTSLTYIQIIQREA